MKTNHISWDSIIHGTVHAYNQNNQHLGYLTIENVGRHRHWVWYQEYGIQMSPGCLDEVRIKQKELFKTRK